jgi:uncharacterized protein YbjQ (UPF0145 family)
MIEGKFITTLPSVVGYDIEKSQGILLDNSVISANKALKGLVKKAEELGCNALVNVRIDSSANGILAYGEGVTVREKPFSY